MTHFALQIAVVLAIIALSSTAITAGDPPVLNETARLDPIDGEPGDTFGQSGSVAINGNLAVVGAPGDQLPGIVAVGALHIYRMDVETHLWQAAQKIQPSEYRNLGLFVSIRDDLIVSSAQPNALVFRETAPGEWTKQQELLTDDSPVEDTRVHIGDDIVLLADENAGIVYVLRWDVDTQEWHQEQTLTPSDGENNHFGVDVARHEGIIVVGAYQASVDEVVRAGAAYVFELDATTGDWAETQRLVPPSPTEGLNFGVNVAVHEGVIVVSAVAQFFPGEAYVFRREPESGQWSQEQRLFASDGNSDDLFGIAVECAKDVIVVGASAPDDQRGAIYAYRYHVRHKEWREVAKLVASDASPIARLGESVSLSWPLVLGGARGVDQETGAAYVFDIAGPRFLRGDVDGNGTCAPLADMLYMLKWAFLEGSEPPCRDAADVDGDNEVFPLIDGLALLRWAFLEATPPPDPGPTTCGPDPDLDDVDCEASPDRCP